MELLPIKEYLHQNEVFTNNPDCMESIGMCIDFYKKVGFDPPWICYYAQLGGQLVGGGAFKGKPVDGKVEIAYVTFPQYQQKGIGTQMAHTLIQLALKTDTDVAITARTLAEENYSARILRKNNFKLLGTIMDEEDGELWEWEYEAPPNPSRKGRALKSLLCRGRFRGSSGLAFLPSPDHSFHPNPQFYNSNIKTYEIQFFREHRRGGIRDLLRHDDFRWRQWRHLGSYR